MRGDVVDALGKVGYSLGRSDPLGEGSFGTVFLLKRNNGSGRPAVAKCFFGHDKGQKGQYENECGIFQGLSAHPNVVEFFEAIDSARILILECCRLGDLSNYIFGRKVSIDERSSFTVMCGITAGLEFLHARGILHGDLKLANVLVRKEPSSGDAGCVAIADFGASSTVLESLNKLHSKEKYVGGTILYRSPESLFEYTNGESKACLYYGVDIWALGMLLWVMCKSDYPAFSLTKDQKRFLSNEQLAEEIRGGMTPDLSVVPTKEIADILQSIFVRTVETNGISCGFIEGVKRPTAAELCAEFKELRSKCESGPPPAKRQCVGGDPVVPPTCQP